MWLRYSRNDLSKARPDEPIVAQVLLVLDRRHELRLVLCPVLDLQLAIDLVHGVDRGAVALHLLAVDGEDDVASLEAGRRDEPPT